MYFISHATFSLLCYFLPLSPPTPCLHSQWALQGRELSSFCNFRLLSFPCKATQCKMSGHSPCLRSAFGKRHFRLLSYPSAIAPESPALALLPYQQDLLLAVRQCPERWVLGISAGTTHLSPPPPAYAAIAPSIPHTGHWPWVVPAPPPVLTGVGEWAQ